MDWLRDLTAVAALFVVRVGVPLLITLLIGRWLSRLDAKWQAEEAEQKKRAQMAGPAQSRRPCWEVMKCDPLLRAQCPAPGLWPLPCWLAHRRASGRIPERCFGCEVFVGA